MKKTATIDLKGKSYATVPARIKEFRTDCPHGSIETKPTMLEDGSIMFSVIIIKDLSDEFSARATGTALSKAKTGDKEKDFEKLETIAVGRALALLGYMASGDIASSEEMEEFQKFQEKKDEEIKHLCKVLEECKTVDELKEKFLSSNLMTNADVVACKNTIYKKLTSVQTEEVKPLAKKVIKKAKVEEGEVEVSLLPPDLK